MASASGSSLSQPSEAMTSTPPRRAFPCREASRRPEAGGELGAAVPVEDLRGGQLHRHPRRPVPQRRGQPGQRRRERERLGPPGAGQRVHEVEVRRRVGPHRLADVDDQGQRPRPSYGAGAAQLHRLPGRATRRRDRRAQRHPAPRGVHPSAAAAAGGPALPGALEPGTDQGQLPLVEVLERGVGDALDGAGQRLGHELPLGGAGVGLDVPRQRVPGQALAGRVRRPGAGRPGTSTSSCAAGRAGRLALDGQRRVAEHRVEDRVEGGQVVRRG